MWKPLTGEPYPGDPAVRFGGRGGLTIPTPIKRSGSCYFFQQELLALRSCLLLLYSLKDHSGILDTTFTGDTQHATTS